MIHSDKQNIITMLKKRTVEVKPVFSLFDKSLEGLLSPSVLSEKENIEEGLKKYQSVKSLPREISIDFLHPRLRNMPALRSAPLAKALYIYCELEVVSTPFLLGLAVNQDFLFRIQDIQSIEVFEETFLFKDKIGKSSQLCLRRSSGKWIVDISTYVRNNLINASEREAGSTINKLSFVEEKVIQSTVEEIDLSDRKIG